MSYINVIMPLVEFVPYINNMVVKYDCVVYLRKKNTKDVLYTSKLNMENYRSVIGDGIEDKLFFFVSLKDYNEAGISFYDDEVCKGTIEGIGGRANENEVELISLRLISKEPEGEIKRLFNAIRNKLKKDPTIGVGVQSGSSRYPKFFYQKSLTDNKVFKFDLNNDKLPVIKPL